MITEYLLTCNYNMSFITLTRFHPDFLEEHGPELLLKLFQILLHKIKKQKPQIQRYDHILQEDMYLEKNLKANFELPLGGFSIMLYLPALLLM